MTATRCTIRQSRAEDGQRAVSIWRAAVEATHDFLPSAELAAIDAEVREFLPQALLWLAVDGDEEVLAFMLLDDGHMQALFVDPDAAGRGIGRALVNHALAIHPELTTDVNEQNPAALGFYEHIGFERTGRSDLDGQGRPFPLIHLRYRPGVQANQ